ncbi:MAG TPA: hypothetical protein VIB39_19445 [Candidatus Angelobacter sp.]|jgi:hypothetical protein
MTKISIFACSLLFLLALPLAGQSANWNIYTDGPGNFSVLFPSQPQDSVNAESPEVKSHTLLARDGKTIYTVVYTVMTSEQKVDDDTFQIFKNAVFKELPKCEVKTEEAPAPALNGYVGHWYRLSCNMPNKVIVEGNLYWGKSYAYAVMTMFPGDTDRPQAEDMFLKSFSVTKTVSQQSQSDQVSFEW